MENMGNVSSVPGFWVTRHRARRYPRVPCPPQNGPAWGRCPAPMWSPPYCLGELRKLVVIRDGQFHAGAKFARRVQGDNLLVDRDRRRATEDQIFRAQFGRAQSNFTVQIGRRNLGLRIVRRQPDVDGEKPQAGALMASRAGTGLSNWLSRLRKPVSKPANPYFCSFASTPSSPSKSAIM